jgi:hypothetical protein
VRRKILLEMKLREYITDCVVALVQANYRRDLLSGVEKDLPDYLVQKHDEIFSRMSVEYNCLEHVLPLPG